MWRRSAPSFYFFSPLMYSGVDSQRVLVTDVFSLCCLAVCLETELKPALAKISEQKQNKRRLISGGVEPVFLYVSEALLVCWQEAPKLCHQPSAVKALCILAPSVLLSIFFVALLHLAFKVCAVALCAELLQVSTSVDAAAKTIYSTRRLKMTHKAEKEVLKVGR